ncbi:hypothetical protein DEO72_LG7g1535 [Vigna unguiculata]|uniref:Uncharacterized protein n=1 Tax=Vigna unguiculata TaxID=3917 RepID=A0A4D6MJS4_VIGUN|nr:hypothetical protein DEO72_LG7g1535 [Vigna unguiculata]
MDRPFYPDLIKFFYSNLRISANGYLQSEVNKKRIKLKPDDWYNIAHLKYEGRKISFTGIPKDIHFDRDMALASMLRPNMQGERAKTVGFININDRLLHYVHDRVNNDDEGQPQPQNVVHDHPVQGTNHFDGLVDFVAMDRPFYPDLIKFFYSNLRISANGYLQSEVNKKRIKLKPDDWYNIAHLKYEGRKISFTGIPKDIHFDRDMALASMLRPNMQGERAKTVGFININDRLLHYVCKASDTPLPYGVLITQIMQYSGVDFSLDANTTIGKRQHFSTRSLKRLNIVYVDGVWQHDRVNNDDEGQPQPQNVVHDHPVQGTNHFDGDFEDPPLHSNSEIIHQMWDGVQDLQNRMQGIEDMQGHVQRIEDNLSNLTLDMNRQMAEVNFNVNLILHKLDD